MIIFNATGGFLRIAEIVRYAYKSKTPRLNYNTKSYRKYLRFMICPTQIDKVLRF